MNSWGKYGETLLPDKEAFYSGLYMEDISDVDHRYANKKILSKKSG